MLSSHSRGMGGSPAIHCSNQAASRAVWAVSRGAACELGASLRHRQGGPAVPDSGAACARAAGASGRSQRSRELPLEVRSLAGGHRRPSEESPEPGQPGGRPVQPLPGRQQTRRSCSGRGGEGLARHRPGAWGESRFERACRCRGLAPQQCLINIHISLRRRLSEAPPPVTPSRSSSSARRDCPLLCRRRTTAVPPTPCG